MGSSIAKSETYVDDILTCLNSPEDCVEAIKQLNSLFNKASMTLHKFSSNLTSLKEHLDPSQLSEAKTTKVLGQIWDIESDHLCFNFSDFETTITKDPCTKRQFLSQAGQLYDPLGLISPLIFEVKLIFQQLWRLEIGWDTPIPTELNERWNQFKSQLPLLKDFLLPRCFFSNNHVQKHDLVTFCDASINGYACVSYLLTTFTDGSKQASFVMSKTRIKPIKALSSDEQVSIVRMELLAMLIGVRLSKHIQEALQDKLSLDSCYFFTDSAINFFRLKKGFATYKPWVANRLKEILTHTSAACWFHVPTDINIADISSRGVTDFTEFLSNENWLHGPKFLYEEKDWTSLSKINSSKVDHSGIPDCELTPTTKLSKIKPVGTSPFISFLCNRYSSWKKTVRLTAYILRFAKRSHFKFRFKKLSVTEFKFTEIFIFSLLQQVTFANEITCLTTKLPLPDKSQLLPHNPIMDHNVLRSKSRLEYSQTLSFQEKYPLILPKHHLLVEKYVLQLHQDNKHLGLNSMLAKLRSRFLILGGRREVSRILRLCTNRNCRRIVPCQQLMAPLPASRLDGTVPFQTVGIDYLGPLIHIGFDKETRVERKVWVCLFTCFVTRAIHLEPILNLGTEEFLNCFRMFVSRRGLPSKVYSDNASTFHAGQKELKLFLSKINWDKISEFALDKEIEWDFFLPYQPHLNGVTERLVRSVKGPLRKTLGKTTVTFRQLQVLLTEIEQIVNTRPLAPVTSSSPIPITPFHLIHGRHFEVLPSQKTSAGLKYIDLWLKRKNLMQSFWKLFTHDYLLQMGIRRKWTRPNDTDLLNQLVLLNDKDMSQFHWKIGKIIQCFPSKDGVVRTVEIQLPTGKVRRNVNTLSLFEQDFLP